MARGCLRLNPSRSDLNRIRGNSPAAEELARAAAASAQAAGLIPPLLDALTPIPITVDVAWVGKLTPEPGPFEKNVGVNSLRRNEITGSNDAVRLRVWTHLSFASQKNCLLSMIWFCEQLVNSQRHAFRICPCVDTIGHAASNLQRSDRKDLGNDI
jgi:hypothetical protein